jgi:hypothetical protein
MNNISLLDGIAQFKMITLQDHARLPDSANHFEAPQLQKAPTRRMKSVTLPNTEFNFFERNLR